MSTDKLSKWEDKWAKGETSWHQAEVNPMLLNNMDDLIGCSRNGEVAAARNILVPLCGKTRDMYHLYSQGHTVVGCEGVEQGCVEFFTDNNLQFTRTPIEGVEGSMFSTEDGRLRIYQCDFLLLTSEIVDLKFDAVWDVQSLVSINPRDRKQYVRTLRSLLKDVFRYLLVTVEYEPFAHLGTPHCISYNAVKELFGSFSNVKFVANVPASPPCKPEWRENLFAMMVGVEDRVQFWQARWATGQSTWQDKPNQYLVKYLDLLTGEQNKSSSAGENKARIFVPLCGKSGDLLWLYQQGHTVLGVEGVPFVVEQFFRENELEHEKTSLPEVNGWKFKSKDGRLTVFACDYFSLTPEMVGPVDCVFDCGSLGEVNVNDRENYCKVMHRLVGKKFNYVLVANEYDDSEFQGPPRNLPRDVVFNLFDNFVDSGADILEEHDVSERCEKFQLEWMQEVVYTVKPAPT